MRHKTQRYCAPASVVRHLEREGLGWGHDLLCGAFDATPPKWQVRRQKTAIRGL